MEETFEAVILANGDFPSHEMPRRVLEQASIVVACDGAVRQWPRAQVVIGDGDSIPSEYREKLIRVDEQEDNDLTKATRYCVDQGWRRIAYLGTTGKREDHTLGNISLMARYLREMGVKPTMLTDYGWLVPAEGNCEFESFKGQQVSIINMGSTRLSSEGLKWACRAYDEWWKGTLNEALGSSFRIDADGFYLVYRTYAAKK